MSARIFSKLAATAFSALLAACNDPDYLTLNPDAGALSVAGSRVGGISSGGALDGGQGGAGGAGVADASSAGGTREGQGGVSCATLLDCLDDDLCNGIELCVNGFCRPGTPLSCNDGNPCSSDACVPATGVCVFTPIDDGLPCADDDRCDGDVCVEGRCVPGEPVVCDDDQSSCTRHVCDPATGSCVFSAVPTGTPCSDGDLCNGTEVCAAGLCLPGMALDCNDGNPCTIDACDALAGCVYENLVDATPCADGDICNGIERCFGGVCRPGTAATCNDHNPCTIDTCNPANGHCVSVPLPDNTPCPDGDVCDGDTCINGVCAPGTPVVCALDNDNNPCTALRCVPATGICVPGNVPDGSPCSDGNVCDGTETCLAGACTVPGTPLSCPDDGNPCTLDACYAGFGCLHVNDDGRSCADADLCNGAESCSGGQCAPGTPVVCALPQLCSPATGACE